MRFFVISFCLIFFSFNLFAQGGGGILATANGHNFSPRDLAPEVREIYERLPQTVSNLRTELLGQQIADLLMETEAAARKTTVEKLIEAEMKGRIASPTEEQIKAVFDANRARIGDKPLAEVRPQIVSFLRGEAEQKALQSFISELQTKYKPVITKDVNAPGIKPVEILASVGTRQISVQSFEQKARQNLYEAQMGIYERTRDTLEQMMYSMLVGVEAQKLGVAPNDLIAREVTDKMREFSDDEREQLETALQKRLFQKYNAKILLKEPAPFVQSVSVDDDPARGSATAPVTIVMFTDFQCPACAATHPVLQKVAAEYGDKVRFVVRDFPLTQIHDNAFKAAQAANAARAQGKFFEYAELLYRNQDSLDTASLKRLAAEAGLNQKQFDADLDSEKYASEVRKDMQDGAGYGIGGTPTIFVNGVRMRQLSTTAFRSAIERALRK